LVVKTHLRSKSLAQRVSQLRKVGGQVGYITQCILPFLPRWAVAHGQSSQFQKERILLMMRKRKRSQNH
jgi:hypothetical protein